MADEVEDLLMETPESVSETAAITSAATVSSDTDSELPGTVCLLIIMIKV